MTFLVTLLNHGPDSYVGGVRTGSSFFSDVLGDHQSQCVTWSTNVGGLRSFGIDTEPMPPGETVQCLSSVEIRANAEDVFLFEVHAGANLLITPPDQIPFDPNPNNNNDDLLINRIGPRQIPTFGQGYAVSCLAVLLLFLGFRTLGVRIQRI